MKIESNNKELDIVGLCIIIIDYPLILFLSCSTSFESSLIDSIKIGTSLSYLTRFVTILSCINKFWWKSFQFLEKNNTIVSSFISILFSSSQSKVYPLIELIFSIGPVICVMLFFNLSSDDVIFYNITCCFTSPVKCVFLFTNLLLPLSQVIEIFVH